MAETSPIVFVAGVRWDGVHATDKVISLELAARGHTVDWLDIPHQTFAPWKHAPEPQLDRGVVINRHWVPRGFSRPLVRSVAAWQTNRAIAALVDRWNGRAGTIIVAAPLALLPRKAPGIRRVFYMTDDWVAGASLMGLNARVLLSRVRTNIARADAVVVVSTELADRVRTWAADLGKRVAVHVVPNGAPPVTRTEGADERSGSDPHALLIGQINTRIDLDLVDAVLDRGVPVTVVGPLSVSDAASAAHWERISGHPLMTWMGRRPVEEIAGFVARASVGLTPYTLSDFNLASSPLKTFDYLAGGLRVVSSDLPASRIIGARTVVCSASAVEFAEAVKTIVDEGPDEQAAELCRQTAQSNSWAARAAAISEIIDL